MFIEYYDAIERSNVSSKDKKTLKDFLELLDKYKYEPDKFSNYTNEELNHIFQIAKISPRLQIEMWQILPADIVNNPENIEIFEGELNEFNRPKIQMSSIKQVTSKVTAVQKRTVMDALKDIRARLQKFFEDFNR